MKIAVFGAGAIGGLLGARLAKVGADVTLIARGPHLAAMRAGGLTLIEADGSQSTVAVAATDDPAKAGPQDYVIVTLKAHSVAAVVADIAPLLGSETAVVWAVNGIPWWYFHGLAGNHENHRLECLDPDDVQWRGLGPERLIGCVVWWASEVVEPGVVRHEYGNRMPLGEPDGSRSARAKALSQLLIEAGFKSPLRPRIRNEIWMKLWGNLSFNPISALTAATMTGMATDPGTRAVARAMMAEAQQVAEALGAEFSIDVDTRIEGAAEVGDHRTSMLQDLERGRPLELEALVGAVAEMGRLVGKPTPTIDSVYALVAQRARTRSAGS
ncbi:MAG TPA: 2-dehydropantoate 2-reductase [Alphaproteobacteria bacterium]|jgi:2-dehydropantoate 2-reductase|nr:2-dehydropantoate 2-reductase [Alphaproteobacteria bacterium]HJM48630.1 2-dehydropantoate 2-reductase [Alphaproteobacteria bacterium]|tara:strand:- start:591 stop:1571 length:981 start_codon:yes stop_codon:yes gene_type:complete